MYPGTAFTRSVGDSTAEKIGVIASSEVSVIQLSPDHLFFVVVASDGVFEFLPSQAVVDMVASHQDPRDACSAIVGESYKLWLTNENRTDDITIIIVHIKGLSSLNVEAVGEVKKVDAKPTDTRAGNSTSDTSITNGSDFYRSAGSNSSDPSQPVISKNNDAAAVTPPPAENSQPT